ncbi:hypothetical protein NP493_39g06043 [Ridgeia piscesae]|uniref:C2H2-type domain-containing protein n=1 Tax=Ridgeia piscesae TaxID=27915 RepID=A0AAD9PCA4_RIDPI|nr:hypothetical protein NP493_39g06043 [Ridgeia piscesae]
MAEDGGGETEVTTSETTFTQNTEVVQLIMQDDAGQAILPEGQLIQVTTGEGQMHYIQVTDSNGEKQLIQIMPDGQAQYLKVDTEDGSTGELIHISTETDEDAMDPGLEGSDNMVTMEMTLAPADGDEQQELKEEQEPGATESPVEFVQEGQQDTTEPQTVLQDPHVPSAESGTEAGEPASQTPPDEAQTSESAAEEAAREKRKLDLKSAIELTSETVVVVGGKKCVLRVDPQTNHLMAYPFQPTPIPGKRGRGRPRKVIKIETTDKTEPVGDKPTANKDSSDSEATLTVPSSVAPSEQESSAIEGLLGLSELDGRRKSLRVKKKSRILTDYETGPVDGEVEDVEEGADPEASSSGSVTPGYLGTPFKRGRGRPPKVSATQNQMQNFLANLGLPVKRGRGRPRRNPPPGSALPGPIPAFIIPSPGGQAVMMAPLQGLNMSALQRNGQLATILPKPPADGDTGVPQHLMTESSDGGTQYQTLGKSTDSTLTPMDGDLTRCIDEAANAAATIDGAERPGEETDMIMGVRMDMDQLSGDVTSGLELTATEMRKGDSGELGAKLSSLMPPAAVIQLPQHLVPLLVPKREPIKIGLKTSESDLERLKCPRCEYQAYYEQQYQEHIANAHVDEVHRCKCCNFATFDKDSLLAHFKDVHPKCICNICEFMAEHAYVIKRHLMRHNTEGCECEVCGKTYKDQYILKMHLKMVHMPAEVLFECTVCSKKFTRKAHLKRHLRIHDPEKPFKCPHCDYRGCERSDITKHLLIHEEPRHVCEVCGKAFRHIKNKELHVKRHKGQRDYKCGVCDFYGYTFTDIRKHIERKHADAKIVCDKCGAAFKNEVMLNEHQHKQCEMLLIEQALTVVEGHGDDTTTIQIPVGHLGGDTTQLLVDGKHVNVLDNMNFEQVSAVTGRWRCSCRTFCSLVCVFIDVTQFFPL